MKKIKFLIPILGLSILLTGCGGLSTSYDYEYAATEGMNSYETDSKAYITGGDYSSTYISGDKVDYSYSFAAGGNSNKSKSEMLKDYEYIQNFVEERDGFIENVYNDYDYYDASDNYINDTTKKYVSSGYLSYTIEIDNEYVPEVLDELEKMCVENKFIVTSFTQQIRNYELYEIVDDYDDYYYYGEQITQQDLDKRLKYADIQVRINYQKPRGKLASFGLGIKQGFRDFWDALGELIQIIIVIGIALFVLFLEIIWFYKIFKKMQYKHRKKHPELYPPKNINIINK